jgi:hypothetical protein
MKRTYALFGIPMLLAGFVGCSSDDIAGPGAPTETVLLNVVPQGGSVDVAPGSTVTIRFNHSMNPAMSEYTAVHEGDLTGPEAVGTWRWSENHTTLTLMPGQPFRPATTHTIHLGGGMMDTNGDHVDFGQHGPGMGGQWATGDMMGGGPMGGGPMGGGPGPHAGEGWEHPTNGSFGMAFTFTTAG